MTCAPRLVPPAPRPPAGLREEILRMVAAVPGITIGELMRSLDLPLALLQPHLIAMERAEQIESMEFGKCVHYYLHGLRREAQASTRLSALDLRVLRFLRSRGEASTTRLALNLEEPRSVIEHHLRRLREQGLVCAHGMQWALADPQASALLAQDALDPPPECFPRLAGFAPLGVARGAPFKGPEHVREAFRVAFQRSPRRTEALAKVEEALLRPRAPGVTPLRVSLCRSFARLDLTGVERAGVLAFVDDALPPQPGGWEKPVAAAVARAARDRAHATLAPDSSLRLLGWCKDYLTRSADIRVTLEWERLREEAGALLADADWRAPDAPDLVAVLRAEWAWSPQEHAPAYMAFLTELAFAAHAWGFTGALRPDELRLSPRDPAAAWKLLLLATVHAAEGRDPAHVLARMRQLRTRDRIIPPPGALVELVRRWPRAWVPRLADLLLDHGGLNTLGAAVVLLEAARVLMETGERPAARRRLDRVPLKVKTWWPDVWDERAEMSNLLIQLEVDEVLARQRVALPARR